jgi:hypothetical protein
MIGPERFQNKIMPEPNSGCWLWTASVNRLGYGHFRWNGSIKGAHRVAYELAHGQIPDNFEIDHKCKVRSCVNPDHLELVTHKINVLRGDSPTAINARKSMCMHGHPLSDDGRGYRCCKTCSNLTSAERSRRYREKYPERCREASLRCRRRKKLLVHK